MEASEVERFYGNHDGVCRSVHLLWAHENMRDAGMADSDDDAVALAAVTLDSDPDLCRCGMRVSTAAVRLS